MNPLSQKTEAERKAIAAKAVATRQQNIREREAQKQANAEHAARLKLKIPDLEAQVSMLESKLAKLKHDDGWSGATMTVAKRGIPCPKCNRDKI